MARPDLQTVTLWRIHVSIETCRADFKCNAGGCSCDLPEAEAWEDALPTQERHTMRTRSIDPKRASAGLGLAMAAILALSFAVINPARAQQRAAADVQASATTLVAAVQQIDPTSVDLNQLSGKGLPYLEDATQHPAQDPPQLTDLTVDEVAGLITVGVNFPDSEQWDGFRQSVAGAATSSCLGPDALSHEEFAVEGLLRLPFLVRAASAGECR
jgi:hypothetical protein